MRSISVSRRSEFCDAIDLRADLRRDGHQRQSGIAMVLALWLTVCWHVSPAVRVQHAQRSARRRNAVSLAQARAAADGLAPEAAACELRRRASPSASDAGRCRLHRWNDGSAAIVVTAVDEASRIDVNTAPDLFLKNLFVVIGGLDDPTSRHARRCDRRLARPGRAAPTQRRRAARVPCRQPEIRPCQCAVRDDRRGGSRAGHRRRCPADRAVDHRLFAPARHQRGHRRAERAARAAERHGGSRRRVHRAAGTGACRQAAVPPFPPAQAFGSGPVPIWRIRAEATMPDGVTFAREAVLRPSPDTQRPLIALAWLEPSRSAAPPSLSSTAPDGIHR